jgi:DNA-binding transcriptional ArsR family regulator
LGELFVVASEPLSITALADRIGFSQPAVSREVRRLHEHGLLTISSVGRTKLVEANAALPWYRELRGLLAQTVGPPALLAGQLRNVSGIAAAYIFGSWAERFGGDPGPFPRDVDLVVIGAPNVDAINAACRVVERALRIDVNPLVVSTEEWRDAGGDEFLGQLRASPLVPIPLDTDESP